MPTVVTDPDQLVYSFTIPQDAYFSAWKNGMLMNEGDEFVFGPDAGQITLTANPAVGDTLVFRRL
ncbi:MAG TPA: hypothetical protein VM537_03490 [Anaerolineae bacterium]|nr:hypothetical protein [Anaerolineae bacterium]